MLSFRDRNVTFKRKYIRKKVKMSYRRKQKNFKFGRNKNLKIINKNKILNNKQIINKNIK